ncbi:MAG TPA: D-aminoacyl-tRNA deacylase [Rhodothermales bacterium]|nr:D-aminoacyl-tRNA deacylase [Rhodothermales bacterium]HRR10077.1 D-aminoacyl-tRNA deacylase [Rhodothermales bacterium]
MIALIQRVSEASVKVAHQIVGEIGNGLLVLLGIHVNDTEKEVDWLVQKIIQLRIFNDQDGKMNRSLQEIGGEILVVSQFTLYGDARKGNRPSYITAARPETAIPLYESFVAKCSDLLGKPVPTGIFGADMKVSLVNDGPVTIWLEKPPKD